MDDSKRFDVSKPGANPASPTSRPIVAARQILVKDPMVGEGKPEAPAEKPEPETPQVAPVALQPSDELKAALETKAQKPAVVPQSPEPEAQDKAMPAGSDQKVRQPEVKPADDDPEVEQLIKDKTYSLPIKDAGAQRTIWLAAAFAAGAAALVYAAINWL